MNEDNISIDALHKAAKALKEDLGKISDLTDELANTLANVYYRFFVNLEHLSKGGNSNLLNPYISDSGSLQENFSIYNNFNAETIAGFEAAKNFVKAIRQAQLKGHEPSLSYLYVLTLDILKYNIDQANTKSAIQRVIERKFKEPREISNLAKMMQNLGKENEKNSPQTCKPSTTDSKQDAEKTDIDIRVNELIMRALELEQQANKARTENDKELGAKVYEELLTILVPKAERFIAQSGNESAFAHYCLGVILRILCIYQDAISEFQKCLSTEPEFYDALLEITGCLAQNGDLVAAEEFAKKAIKVKPNEAAAWGNLAMVLIQNGSKKEAFDAITKAMKLNPSDAKNRYIFENFERYFT